MSNDKKRLYLISLTTLAVLLAILLLPYGNSKIITALALIPIAAATYFLVKKRGSLSISKREVLLLSVVIGALYVVLLQMTGLFFDFYKNPYFVTSQTILTTVLPLAGIIIAVEIIRSVMLAQKSKFVTVITYLSCVLVEVLMFSNVANITSFNRFMDLVGMTLFPAISANLYYHYVSKNYGMLPNIAFRLITTLYVYFLPTASGMSDAMLSCIKIILPILLLTFVMALYEKKKKNAVQKGRTLGVLGTVLSLAIIVSVAMLISCQFRFGALVIATESMTGEINKGDMIIYEQYDDQIIEEGQVIVFLQNENKIVHRVVRIDRIGSERRYYTKGDANEDMDQGFISDKEIVGLTDVKIPYVGFPTLWLREIIEK